MRRHRELRVLLYTREFPPHKAGAGRYVAQLAAALDIRGVPVHVLAPSYERLEPEVMSIDDSSVSRFDDVSVIRNGWHLLRAVLRHRANHIVIAEQGALTDFTVIPLPHFVDFSVVAYGTEVLNHLRSQQDRADVKGLQRFEAVFHFAHRIFVISLATQALVERCGFAKEKCLIVYPAVDPLSVPDPEPGMVERLKLRYGLHGQPVVMTIARLDIDKGHDVLLDSFSRVLKRYSDATLVIVGDGEQRLALENRAKRLGITESVRFAGRVPPQEIAAHHEISTFFAMPSRSVERFEGFGIVFIEAAHRRRTSVAGNHGGSPEAVEDGITGLVVDPTDVEAVARAMSKLLDDEELRESLARKAQERAANRFTIQTMAESLDTWHTQAALAICQRGRNLPLLVIWVAKMTMLSLGRLPRAAVRRLLRLKASKGFEAAGGSENERDEM